MNLEAADCRVGQASSLSHRNTTRPEQWCPDLRVVSALCADSSSHRLDATSNQDTAAFSV